MPYSADVFTNFATSTIRGGAGGSGQPLNPTDTSLLLATGDGAKFPTPSGGTSCRILIGTGDIAKVTAVSGDTLTLVRRNSLPTTDPDYNASAPPTAAVGTSVQLVFSAANGTDPWTAINNNRPFYVADYGTDGTGAAIQAALNALPAAGGVVALTQGKSYTLTAQLTHSFSANERLRIEGNGATIVSTLAEPGSETGILAFTGDSGATAELVISNLAISHTNSGLGLRDGIYIVPLNYGSGGTQSLERVVLDRCTVSGVSFDGIQIVGATNVTAIGCNSSGNRDAGLSCTGGDNILIAGGQYNTNVTGGLSGDYGVTLRTSSFVGPATNVEISGIEAKNNGRKGIDVHHGHKVHIVGNTCTGNGYVGIYAVMEDSTKDTGDITIIGNTCDQTGGNNTLANYGINVGTFGTTGALTPGSIIVTGNRVIACDAGTTASAGIRVMCATTGVAPERVVISGNTFKKAAGSAGVIIWCDNGGTTIGAVEVSNNICHAASTAHGILISAATDVIIADNILRVDSGTATDGINIPSTANAIIEGNMLLGGATYTTPITAIGATQLVQNNTLAGLPLASGAAAVPTLTSVNADVGSQTISGNALRGQVTFNTITAAPAAGTALFTVTFATALPAAPGAVLLTNYSNTSTSGFYVTGASTTGFTVRNASALPEPASGFVVAYLVVP